MKNPHAHYLVRVENFSCTPKIFGSIDVGPGPMEHTKENAGVHGAIFNIFQP